MSGTKFWNSGVGVISKEHMLISKEGDDFEALTPIFM